MQIDKIAWDSMQDHAELHLQSLEPWVQVLLLYFYLFSIWSSLINPKQLIEAFQFFHFGCMPSC